MVQINEPQSLSFSLHFESQDVEITGSKILTWNLQGSFTDTAFDTFRCQLQDVENPAALEALTRPLEPCTFRINGRTQFIGRILARDISDTGEHSISCADYRADLVKSYIDPKIQVIKGQTLEKALLALGGSQGISEIEAGFSDFKTLACPEAVSANSSDPFDISKKVEDRTTKQNEGTFQKMLRVCERTGCTLQVSSARNRLSVATPSYKQSPLFFIRRTNLGTDKAFSNVTAASLSEDYSEVPTVYVSTGNGFSVSGQGWTQLSNTAEVFGPNAILPVGSNPRVLQNVEDNIQSGRVKAGETLDVSSGKLYRPRYLNSTECRTKAELDELVKREISNSFRSVFQLKYTMPDILQNPTEGFAGGLYCYDTMCSVKDEIFGLDGDFYIAGRSLSFSQSGGTSASLDLALPYSYLA